MKRLDKLLQLSSPFSALPAAQRGAFERTAFLRSLRPGEALFSEGESASASWLIVEGELRIFGCAREGRTLELERFGAGQLVGCYCRLGGKPRSYPCTAIADVPSVVARVPDDAFERWFASFPEFARAAGLRCSERLWAMRRVAIGRRDTVELRLARALLSLSAKQGNVVKATRRELAAITGAALETVFRALARLRRRGWLATSPGRVVLKQPERLAEFARGGGTMTDVIAPAPRPR